MVHLQDITISAVNDEFKKVFNFDAIEEQKTIKTMCSKRSVIKNTNSDIMYVDCPDCIKAYNEYLKNEEILKLVMEQLKG
jgi:hypothetical protein